MQSRSFNLDKHFFTTVKLVRRDDYSLTVKIESIQEQVSVFFSFFLSEIIRMHIYINLSILSSCHLSVLEDRSQEVRVTINDVDDDRRLQSLKAPTTGKDATLKRFSSFD
jgi:hypothetical protein